MDNNLNGMLTNMIDPQQLMGTATMLDASQQQQLMSGKLENQQNNLMDMSQMNVNNSLMSGNPDLDENNEENYNNNNNMNNDNNNDNENENNMNDENSNEQSNNDLSIGQGILNFLFQFIYNNLTQIKGQKRQASGDFDSTGNTPNQFQKKRQKTGNFNNNNNNNNYNNNNRNNANMAGKVELRILLPSKVKILTNYIL
jgi:hypothetical protein